MSFGFSPSDFVTLITIVTKSYKGWRDACGEYTDITTSLKQLLSLIRQVQDHTRSDDSALVRTPGDRAALESILRSSKRTAQELGEIIKDYDALGHGKSREKNWADLERNWKRFKFGNKDLQGLRSKIQGHVNMISAHLTAAGVSALSRIELDIKALPDQMQRTIDGLAAEIRAGHREGSVLTTYDDDEKDVWRQFRRELIGEGMRSSMIHHFKPRIKCYLRALAEEGLLEECEPELNDNAENVEAPDRTALDRNHESVQLSPDDDGAYEQVGLNGPQSVKAVGNPPSLTDTTTLTSRPSDHTAPVSTEDGPSLGLPATCITDDEAESEHESIESGVSASQVAMQATDPDFMEQSDPDGLVVRNEDTAADFTATNPHPSKADQPPGAKQRAAAAALSTPQIHVSDAGGTSAKGQRLGPTGVSPPTQLSRSRESMQSDSTSHSGIPQDVRADGKNSGHRSPDRSRKSIEHQQMEGSTKMHAMNSGYNVNRGEGVIPPISPGERPRVATYDTEIREPPDPASSSTTTSKKPASRLGFHRGSIKGSARPQKNAGRDRRCEHRFPQQLSQGNAYGKPSLYGEPGLYGEPRLYGEVCSGAYGPSSTWNSKDHTSAQDQKAAGSWIPPLPAHDSVDSSPSGTGEWVGATARA